MTRLAHRRDCRARRGDHRLPDRHAARAERAETLRVELESTRAKLTSESDLRARQAELLAQSEAQVRLSVENASRAALEANSETFLKLAREVFGRDQAAATTTLKEREEAISRSWSRSMWRWLKQEEQAQALERERRETLGNLSTPDRIPRQGTGPPCSAKRATSHGIATPRSARPLGRAHASARGELAGMSEHCDFTEQAQVSGEHGALRPDLIVRMPEARSIVVDAKTRSTPTSTRSEAQDDDARRAALRRHAQQVEQRVRELGAKSYWEQFEQSPEFAVLFLPGDQFLSAALAERPDLIDSALKQRIIVTTPSTLMALLKVIAYGWRQTKVTENAREIREFGAGPAQAAQCLREPPAEGRPVAG